jgi:hypothetical protein
VAVIGEKFALPPTVEEAVVKFTGNIIMKPKLLSEMEPTMIDDLLSIKKPLLL